MAIISAQTSFTVQAGTVEVSSVDVPFAPSTPGTNALRILDPPPVVLSFPLKGPLVYECNPAKWTNFDTTGPMKRVFTRHQTTIGGAVTQTFAGFEKDVVVTEIWDGGGDRVSMTLGFFRVLYQFYANIPNFDTEGHVRWTPKDLTATRYDIVILDLLIGNRPVVTFDTVAHIGGFVLDSVTFRFAIVGASV